MSLTITKVNLPQSQYAIKCPFSMDPEGLTIHNTANDASAMAEVSYMQGNPYEVSFHYAVDDTRAVQGLPLNRNGWHAGDGGKGKGNRKTIGLEICYSKSGEARFTKAEKNGAILAAMILKAHGWSIERMGKHQDYWQGTYYKYCPHRTLDLGWKRFVKMVQSELDKLNGKTVQSPKTETKPSTSKNKKPLTDGKVGDTVKVVDALYADSTGAGRSTASRGKQGTIQKMVKSGKKYHIIGTGFSGWAHPNDIQLVSRAATSKPSSASKTPAQNVPTKSLTDIAREVLAGAWGNGDDRKKRLEARGYNFSKVQAEVNRLSGLQSKPAATKSINTVAKEVIAGKWGNGDARKKAIQNAGYDYNKVQAEVNNLSGAKSSPKLKSVNTVAKEVIKGDWGNGDDRRKRLEKAGYNFNEVQKAVNKLV